jgi:hypothetical protein
MLPLCPRCHYGKGKPRQVDITSAVQGQRKLQRMIQQHGDIRGVGPRTCASSEYPTGEHRKLPELPRHKLSS